MGAEAQEYVNNLMSDFRELVLGIQEERRELKQKLKEFPLQTTTSSSTLPADYRQQQQQRHRDHNHNQRYHNNNNSNHSSDSAASSINVHTTATASPTDEPSTNTISSGTFSTTNTGSTRPPPYKSVVKLPQHLHHTHNRPAPPPQPPPPPPEPPQPKPPVRTRRRTVTLSSNSNTINTEMSSSVTNGAATVVNGVARGALIVLEGLDRVGKSTLAKKLGEHLERTRRPVSSCRFPERTTPIGQLINDFLKSGSKKVDDHAMHLLFSANRWELNKKIRHTIAQGTTVIIDRYSYSGIAYSCSKRDLTMEWCCETEKGLPKPDLVIYLELPSEAQYKRPGFGDERFETKELQELVRIQYERLMDISREQWLRIDVENKSPDQVLGEIIVPVKRCLDSCANKELGNLDLS